MIPITIGLLVAYIIQTACRYYVTYAGHMMGARMERDMRKELFDQYEKLSFSYYDQNNSGQMMSKLVSDLLIYRSLRITDRRIFYIAYKDNRFVHFSFYDKPYACGSYAYSCGAYACIFIWPE